MFRRQNQVQIRQRKPISQRIAETAVRHASRAAFGTHVPLFHFHIFYLCFNVFPSIRFPKSTSKSESRLRRVQVRFISEAIHDLFHGPIHGPIHGPAGFPRLPVSIPSDSANGTSGSRGLSSLPRRQRQIHPTSGIDSSLSALFSSRSFSALLSSRYSRRQGILPDDFLSLSQRLPFPRLRFRHSSRQSPRLALSRLSQRLWLSRFALSRSGLSRFISRSGSVAFWFPRFFARKRKTLKNPG